jgi:hypothetical protein
MRGEEKNQGAPDFLKHFIRPAQKLTPIALTNTRRSVEAGMTNPFVPITTLQLMRDRLKVINRIADRI